MRSKKFSIGLSFVLATAVVALATPPATISYQGTITDSDGNPPPDNTYQITFSIWDDPAAGNELWTEIQTVQLTSGRFNVLLGAIQPPEPEVFDGGNVWLQVQLEGDTPMMPRTMLTGVPFSTQTQRVAGDIQTGDGLLQLHPPEPGYPQTIVLSTDISRANMSMVSPGPPDNSINMAADGDGSSLLMTNPGPPDISLGLTADNDNARISFNGNPGPPDMELLSSPSGESHFIIWDSQADLGLAMNVNDDSSSLVMTNPGPPDNSVGLRADANGSVIQLLGANPGPPEMELSSSTSGESHFIIWDSQADLGLAMNVNDDSSSLVMTNPGPPDNSVGIIADDNSSTVQLFGYNPGPPEIAMMTDPSTSTLSMLNPTLPAIQMNMVNGGSGASLAVTDTDIPILTMSYDGTYGSFAISDPGRTGMTYSALATEQRYTDASANLLAQIGPAGFNFISPGPPDIDVGGSAASSEGKLGIYLGTPDVPPNPCVEIGYDGSAANLLMINPGPPESYSLNASISQTAGNMSFHDAAGNENVRFDGDGNGFFSGNMGIGAGMSAPTNILTIQERSDTDPIADAWTVYSSRRWKKNIKTIDNALDKVERLRGVTFDWKADDKHDIGLIAEEVGEVIPEVVAYEENGVDARSVDYARLVSVLIEAVKEQQAEIDNLKDKLNQVSSKVASLGVPANTRYSSFEKQGVEK